MREIFKEGLQWAIEQVIKFWWRFGRHMDTGIVFQIRHYWEIWKVVNGHSLMLICQIAALVRRALAEVCTVPVLQVLLYFASNGISLISQRYYHGVYI